jgi:hypothetical protein
MIRQLQESKNYPIRRKEKQNHGDCIFHNQEGNIFILRNVSFLPEVRMRTYRWHFSYSWRFN